jgi:glycosidase
VWHKLVAELQGNKIKVWVDGVFVFEHVDDRSPFLQGTVGFITYQAEPVHFDNLVVTPLN